MLNELRREQPDLEVDLNAADGWQFLDALFAVEPNLLDTGFREALFRQTLGHPLFTLELLEGLREKGILARDSKGVWDQKASFAWEDLPARVEAVVAERLGRLPEDLYRILAAASIEGEDFTAEALARMQGVGEREMVQILSGELERRHLLVRAVGVQRLGGRRLSRYRFSHIVFQKYLYGRMAEAERSYLHEELGGILEDLHGDRAGEIAPVLARHFAEAGATAKAVEHYGRAGHAASRLSAHVEAIAHYEEALRLLRGLPADRERDRAELGVLTALAPALNTTQGYASPAVERICDRALELARELGGGREFGWVLHGIWSHAFVSGAFEGALDLASRLVQFGEAQDDPALRMQGHYSLGVVSQYRGDFAASREHGERCWELVQAHGSAASIQFAGQDVGVMVQNSLSWTCWVLGYPEQALAWRDGATGTGAGNFAPLEPLDGPLLLDLAPPVPRRPGAGRGRDPRAHRRVGGAGGLPGDPGEDGAGLGPGHAGRRYGEPGHGWSAPWPRCARPTTSTRRPARGSPRRSTCCCGSTPASSTAVSRRRGRPWRQAFAIAGSTGEGFWEPELHRQRGNLALRTGEEGAEEHYQKALAISRRQRARSHELRAATDLARLWAGQGRREEARELLAAVYDGFTEGFETADLSAARALLADLSLILRGVQPVQAGDRVGDQELHLPAVLPVDDPLEDDPREGLDRPVGKAVDPALPDRDDLQQEPLEEAAPGHRRDAEVGAGLVAHQVIPCRSAASRRAPASAAGGGSGRCNMFTWSRVRISPPGFPATYWRRE